MTICQYRFDANDLQYGYDLGELCGEERTDDPFKVCHESDCILSVTGDWYGNARYACGCHGHEFVEEAESERQDVGGDR